MFLRSRGMEARNADRRGPAGSASRNGASSSANSRGVSERECFREGLDEEVERIDDRHVGDEIDGDDEFAGLFRKYEAREPVAVRILQPVHEMLRRRHLERIAQYAGAAMRRRPQPDDLRTETDRAVVLIARGVVEADQDRHTPL